MKNKIIMKNKTILSILGALGATTISALGVGVLLKKLPDGEITNNTNYPLVLIADGKLEIIQSGETKKGDGITFPIINKDCTISGISPTIKVTNLEILELKQIVTLVGTNIAYENKTNFLLIEILNAYKTSRNKNEGKETRGVNIFEDITKHNENLTEQILPYVLPVDSFGGLGGYDLTKETHSFLEETVGPIPNPKYVSISELTVSSNKNLEACK